MSVSSPGLNRRAIMAAAAAAAAVPALRQANAQQAAATAAAWRPDRPLRLIVPFNAGGITDVMSRAVSQALTPVIGQSVVVDNRPGANGSIGSVAAARAAPDGLTMIMGITDTHAINPNSFRRLPYDPARDFTPITFVARVPFAVIAALILVICAIGAYTVNNAWFDVVVMLAFGALGYAMKKLDYPLAPLVLALVLGSRTEQAFRQSMLSSGGDLGVFWSNWLVGTIMTAGVVLLFWPVFSRVRGAIKVQMARRAG